MRLFLAGPVPEQLQESLLARLEPLRRAAPQVRWAQAGQLHLTLAFLGEVGAPNLPPMVERLGPVVGRHPPLTLTVRGVGCFGRPRRPTVLFAEIAGDRPALGALADELHDALRSWAPRLDAGERPFHPHLTLARARARNGDASLLRCRSALGDLDLGSFPVRRLLLFESRLLPTGAEHTEVAEFPLGTDGAPPA